MSAGYRSGFVGIVGRPNVGKSTLLNHYLGETIAIVSPHPQTTRHRIVGILTRDDAQMVFLDTPGLHEPQHALGRAMVEAAKAVLDDADVLLVVVDAKTGVTEADRRVFDKVRRALQFKSGKSSRSALLAINKVDAVKKPLLLPLLEACASLNLFSACIPVSAKTGDQMDVLLREIIHRLPEGPRWYEPGQRTDQPIPQRVSELIRDPILQATRQEVPHVVGILVDQIEEQERVTAIQATILVERPGQKAILIGRGGEMLKRVGQEARRTIERLLGRKVYLGLWVKVAPDWRNNEPLLRQMGLWG